MIIFLQLFVKYSIAEFKLHGKNQLNNLNLRVEIMILKRYTITFFIETKYVQCTSSENDEILFDLW